MQKQTHFGYREEYPEALRRTSTATPSNGEKCKNKPTTRLEA